MPEMSGVYAFCFSNEFSTISHKIVYMDLQVGDEKPLPIIGEHITVMTLVGILWPIKISTYQNLQLQFLITLPYFFCKFRL